MRTTENRPVLRCAARGASRAADADDGDDGAGATRRGAGGAGRVGTVSQGGDPQRCCGPRSRPGPWGRASLRALAATAGPGPLRPQPFFEHSRAPRALLSLRAHKPCGHRRPVAAGPQCPARGGSSLEILPGLASARRRRRRPQLSQLQVAAAQSPSQSCPGPGGPPFA